jgi:hypothetical protein
MTNQGTNMRKMQLSTAGNLIMALITLAAAAPALASGSDGDGIRPYSANPYYWQYKGKPVLLLGGTWQDNLFNHPIGLERHLDLLKSSGGNYARNVMSHRNVGNVFAYAQREDGKFDLDVFNEEYWRRFENFLRMTHERDIIVQIEIWATWDHYEDHQSLGGWSKHPFNPANNVNYTAEESGLPHQVGYDPGKPIAYTFFRSVPALNNYELTLRYQQGFVNKLLSHSLQYPHVLYCMNNETEEPIEWGDYWARYVRSQAAEAGKQVEVAEMRRHHDITSSTHRHMINHPDLYSFLDVSQNNWEAGQTHWDRILQIRALVQDRPRPINNNKIYSAGNEEEAVARMFRIIFAGGASARFHRPHPREDLDAHEAATDFGLGLSPRAQATLRAARTFTEAMNVFACQPQNDLLGERSPNEAYCLAEPGRQYAVYFPDGGEVTLDASSAKGKMQVRWLDISRNAWQEPQTVDGGGTLKLRTPGKGHWAALILTR